MCAQCMQAVHVALSRLRNESGRKALLVQAGKGCAICI